LSHGDGADADQVEESAFLVLTNQMSAAEAPLAALVALTTEVLKNRREAIEAAIASGDEVRVGGWGGWGLFLSFFLSLSLSLALCLSMHFSVPPFVSSACHRHLCLRMIIDSAVLLYVLFNPQMDCFFFCTMWCPGRGPG
jgi:hypothetical protein